MRNLDAAKAAFAEWVRRYEDPPPNRPECSDAGAALLAALHACGVSAETRSFWREKSTGRIVELLAYSSQCVEENHRRIAVFRQDDHGNFHMPSKAFLEDFAPLASPQTDTARGGAGG